MWMLTSQTFVDADYANSFDDCHSISGYAFFLNGGPISWQSRSVVLSTMEAEFMTAATASNEEPAKDINLLYLILILLD